MRDDPPTQVSIRTGDGNAWRYDSIQRAADFYGVNRSDAVAFACEDVPAIVRASSPCFNETISRPASGVRLPSGSTGSHED